MSLAPGTRLGRYEISTPLGAGGMGEVYRARDTRLDRDVAIKILPPSVATDPDRLARFEREAKAVAALSHPNILALHDAGTENGTTFAVMELLEGETLRDRLMHGALGVRRSVDTAVQISRGLAAAHAKGLIHRDLKPENVFLLADGQVKILDFGLAKTADLGDSSATATHSPAMTDPGTVLGTVGYMAPEQVRGHAIDARTDIFALGLVLFEMLTGERAFRRETAAETMTAILREDPPDLPVTQSAQAPALDRIIRHCLEKSPSERFQSAKDVAFALETISGTTGTTGTTSTTGTTGARGGFLGSRTSVLAAALGIVVVAGLGAWVAGFLHLGRAQSTGAAIADVTYQPVTFEEGFVFAARFARDGRTIVYSADWDNQTRDIFVTSLDSSGARALGYKGADLLAVAPDGALAILVESFLPAGNPYGRRGTIARASLTGGAPRKELDGVSFADFAPDGQLAVARSNDLQTPMALEWPQGQIVIKATRAGHNAVPNPRVSPSGQYLAYFNCDTAACTVRIADKTGRTVAESKPYADWWGLAWASGTQEVWFSVAETSGRQCTLFALDVSGRQRLVNRAPGALTVHDVSAEGRLLASYDQVRSQLEMRSGATGAPSDLSWKEGGTLVDVSAAGHVLSQQVGDSGGPTGSVYVRRPGDKEPLRISDGLGLALSEDGGKALVRSFNRPLQLSIVPTTGLAQKIDVGEIDDVSGAGWLADGRLLLDLRRDPNSASRVYVRPANGGPLTPLLPEGLRLLGSRLFSPDGRRIVVLRSATPSRESVAGFSREDDTGALVCSVATGSTPSCEPVRGIEPGEFVTGWAADNKSIFVYRRHTQPVRIERVDVTSGKRAPHTILQTMTPAVSGLSALWITPDGSIFYNYGRSRTTLYVIGGLK